MNNKPVAWRRVIGNVTKHYEYNEVGVGEPLYSLETIRQQQAEIEALKDLVEAYRDDNRTSESFDRTASHMAGEYVAHSNCNGFCGEYECKENKEGCKRNDCQS